MQRNYTKLVIGLIVLVTFAAASYAYQETTVRVASHTASGRFQILGTAITKPLAIKIDTQTGDTWAFEMFDAAGNRQYTWIRVQDEAGEGSRK